MHVVGWLTWAVLIVVVAWALEGARAEPAVRSADGA